MKKRALLPLLEAIYLRDEEVFKKLALQLRDLEAQRVSLTQVPPSDVEHVDLCLVRETHLRWRRQKIDEILDRERKLKADMRIAKQKFGKALGRFEAMKRIIGDVER